MSTVQRRRGQKIQFWRSRNTVNKRGDEVKMADDGPFEATVWVIPQRSSRAEVPGQQEINVIRIGGNADLDMDLWSRVRWSGWDWDIASPPALHWGTRGTRHLSIDLRRRTVVNG